MASVGPIATEAFPLWLEVLGVDPSRLAPLDAPETGEKHDPSQDDEREEGESFTLGDLEAIEAAIEIHDALLLQDGELTAQMLLSRQRADFIQQQSYTLEEILAWPDRLRRQVECVRAIGKILDRDDLVLSRAQFSETLQQALDHYSASSREDVLEIIEDDASLGVLRRDALGALDKMAVAQFLQGHAGPAIRPQYSTVLRRWWSLDHMLAAHTLIPEGVSLNLVKTPSDHDMFFCFVVRRGANLYVLHDAPDYEHPLQSQMTRRPDRRFAERIGKFWFPYEMADVEMSADGREARLANASQGRSLVLEGKVDQVSQVIGTVSEMPARELLWAVMMFDLIMDRFWSEQPLPCLSLSYTAAQMVPQNELVQEAARAAGLPVSVGTPGALAVPDLTVKEVSELGGSSDAEQVLGETQGLGALTWIEQRYRDQVPQAALNPIALNPGTVMRLGFDGKVAERSPSRSMLSEGKETSLATLKALEATSFGTAQQMRANRAFLARFNYAKTLGALAAQEYKRSHAEVRAWLDQAYASRVEFLKSLVPASFEKGLEVCDWKTGCGPEVFEFVGGHGVSFRDTTFASREERKAGCTHLLAWMHPIDNDYSSTSFMPYLRTGSEAPRNWKAMCQETQQKASYFFAVRPTNSTELAWLLGLEVAELPEVLQHMSALHPCPGNSILNRVDPLLWALENPWKKFELGVRMGVSKRGLALLQKRYPSTVDLSHLAGENLRLFQASRS